VAFIVDDLVAWLVGLLADAGRKKLTKLILGDEQTRALRPAAAVALRFTAAELCPGDAKRAEELAIMIEPLFKTPGPGAPLGEQATVLEALQAGISEELKVLDSPPLTATVKTLTGRDVPATTVAQKLTGHLVQQIMIDGSRGGPLAPLAAQLNHDVTHLQGQRQEGMLSQLIDMVRALASAGESLQVPSKPVRLAPRPAHLAGREGLLAHLDIMPTSGDDSGPRIVALCGLGGAGKTSVAVEYAYRHLDEVGVAWQFPAENPTVMAAGFADLAAQLGARKRGDVRDPVDSVHAVLAAYRQPWLLLFDNAPDRAAVQALLPPAGKGQVLITSRSALWPPRQMVEVPVLDPEVAARFLVNRTGDDNGQAAAELAEELGGLPLALEQAAAYIQASGGSLADYLASFRRRRRDMLARRPGESDKTVATTWSLAFTELEQSAPQAVGLLRLLACCAPEPVPVRLLLQPRPGLAEEFAGEVAPVLGPLVDDELAAGDAVAALRRYSLVNPAEDGLVSVHRLVQAVTLDQLPVEVASQWRLAAAALIEAAIPEDTDRPGTWPTCAVLLPHAQAALPAGSDAIARLANYLGERGSHTAAVKLWRQVADARERS
jgi:hypothetical protein